MAGIGFELRKVVRKGDPLSFFRMAISGAVIVAGPWLVSVAAVGILQVFADTVLASRGNLFTAVLVYVYAGSLILFGGTHYLFSRIVSDLLYEKKEGICLAYLVWFSVVVAVLSTAIGGTAAVLVPLSGIPHEGIFRFSSAIFFVLVSVHWLFLLHLSLLKWYGRVFLVYALGMGISAASSFPLSAAFGTGGVILGFALGQIFILAAAFVLVVRAYPEPDLGPTFRKAPGVVFRYLDKNLHLVLTGAAYYLAMWVDKLVFWMLRGARVEGTPFLLSPEYDRIVYFANLAMIPGLVFFVVFSETEFYVFLRKFLENLGTKRYRVLLEMKNRVFTSAREAIAGLAVFQAAVTVCLMLLVPAAVERGILSPGPSPYLLLAAVFFHLVFFALMSFLFFTEAFRAALLGALVFLAVNLAASIVSATADFPSGLSYLLAAGSACIFSFGALRLSLGSLERRIFSRSSEGG